MTDLKRISWLAVLLLVLLRLSIGWQFLYEGLWKYQTLSTPNPWTARGYLVNAEGPFRDYFRSLVGDFPQGNDPDDLLWLDYDAVSAAWDRWAERFTQHYRLNDEQRERLQRLLDGPPQWSYPLRQLPESVRPKLETLRKFWEQIERNPEAGRGVDLADLRYEGGQLILSGKTPLKPDEVQQMFKWVGAALTQRVEGGQLKQTLAKADADGNPLFDEHGEPIRMEPGPERDFATAVVALDTLSRTGLSYRAKLRASLRGDPNRVGVHKLAGQPGTVMGPPPPRPGTHVELLRYGEISEYKDELAAYERLRARATMPYEFEHLARLRTKLEGLRAKVVGPVKALDLDFKTAARALLTPEQVAIGPLPPESTPLLRASAQAMWGLLILGALLMIGFCTRLAAVGGAVMLTMFYLVVPPWPGVPEPAGTTEHALFINKNLIEAIALLGIAVLPTGSWFGLDGVLRWLFRRS